MEEQNAAGFWIRFLAVVIDSFLVGMIVILLGIGQSHFQVDTETYNNIVTVNQQFESFRTIGHIMDLFTAIATILFWTYWNGQTPGKKLMGIKVVSVDNEPLTLGQSFLRYIGYIISSLMFFIGFIMIGVRRDKRGLHDLIARTKVIYTR